MSGQTSGQSEVHNHSINTNKMANCILEVPKHSERPSLLPGDMITEDAILELEEVHPKRPRIEAEQKMAEET